MIKLSRKIETMSELQNIGACPGTWVSVSTSATSLLCNGIKPECTITLPLRNKLKCIAYKGMTAYSGQVTDLNN